MSATDDVVQRVGEATRPGWFAAHERGEIVAHVLQGLTDDDLLALLVERGVLEPTGQTKYADGYTVVYTAHGPLVPWATNAGTRPQLDLA